MKGYRFEESPDLAMALQREAREAMKLRLMEDILLDMEVCRIQGWDWLGYLGELKELIDGLCSAGTRG